MLAKAALLAFGEWFFLFLLIDNFQNNTQSSE
jgi:hypothetical protein